MANTKTFTKSYWLRFAGLLGAYIAHAVADGYEALESISRVKYDLVLMDCQMPEMDGYLSKPVKLDVLEEKLRRWFPRERTA